MAINFSALENQLVAKFNDDFVIDSTTQVSGGSICEAYKIKVGSTLYFLKTHKAGFHSMFANELYSLHALSATNTICVPTPLVSDIIDDYCYLLLEYLDIHSRGSYAQLGESLAHLHQNTSNQFGWDQNNWIGTTPQPNDWHRNWLIFWRQCRLGYQLDLAKHNQAPHSLIKNCEQLYTEFDSLFQNYSPIPSLLHGDLWCGNVGFIENGSPILFDPACYYGDRETDLAMTQLFNGFDQEFYSAYKDHFPLDRDYEIRKDFYNIYHLLNHFNLFSDGYAEQTERLCLEVLSAIK